MNEKIRELFHQAYGYSIDIVGEQAEKFAELIVRDCIGVVKGGSFLHDQAPTAIFARECSDAINRHFGVEE